VIARVPGSTPVTTILSQNRLCRAEDEGSDLVVASELLTGSRDGAHRLLRGIAFRRCSFRAPRFRK
jgi:hypothetical protein